MFLSALLTKLLIKQKTAPSGVNTQPWQVAVVTGESKDRLCSKLEKAFRDGKKGTMDYKYYPVEWLGEFKQRRKECGLLMYSTLGIKREDKQRQLDQWALNYQAFNLSLIHI